MNVLVACEESQVVCKAFRDRGHEAYSCDILQCSGGYPEWHIQCDVLKILNPCMCWLPGEVYGYGIQFCTVDGIHHFVPDHWDLIIAHPPCTYLSVTGNRWFNVDRYGEKALERIANRKNAIDFFMEIVNAYCDRIAIENPVGVMSSHYRSPDQIINPYLFGDPFEKKTCLWLKGLPLLTPTNIVEPPPRKQFESGKTMPSWYADSWYLPKDERAKLRSKTFPGIAKAMAEQWGCYYEK